MTEPDRESLLREVSRLRAELARVTPDRLHELEEAQERLEQRTREDSLAAELAEQRAAEEQVRLAQRMEAMGMLAASVAHDFNNLVQVVHGFATLALSHLAVEHPSREPIERVLEASARAAELTPQLMALARRTPLHKAPLELNALVQNMLGMITRLLGPSIEVSFDPAPAPALISADRTQLERALLALCFQAREGMSDGGQVAITVGQAPVDAELRQRHPWLRAERCVRLCVEDTGTPIEREALSRIFEPFYSARTREHGADIGLAMVYATVRHHDGTILADNLPGKGTRFEILLPAIRAEAQAEVEQSPAVAPTVLVAEDEPLVRTLTQRILERAGFRVITAPNGSDACKLFQAHRDEVRLVVLDLVMPAMGGFEAYELMSAMKPDVGVLFVSGYQDQLFTSHAVQPPGTELLYKPFQAEQLLTRVYRILGGV